MIKIISLLFTALLASCATESPPPTASAAIEPSKGPVENRGERIASRATSVNAYKLDLAQRIAAANSAKIYSGRPQALLRSVVVLKYAVDANGNLVRSEIMRSNRDRTTESTALASLRSSAPFPKPAASLLQRGRVELSETWLFNNDGRFQLRTIALPQMDR